MPESKLKIFFCIMPLMLFMAAADASAAETCGSGDMTTAKKLAGSVVPGNENIDETYSSINRAYGALFGPDCEVNGDISGISVIDKNTGNKMHIPIFLLGGSIYKMVEPQTMENVFSIARSVLAEMRFRGFTGESAFMHIEMGAD